MVRKYRLGSNLLTCTDSFLRDGKQRVKINGSVSVGRLGCLSYCRNWCLVRSQLFLIYINNLGINISSLRDTKLTGL